LRDLIPPLEPDACPALEFFVVEWDAVAAAGEDQQPGADQLITDMSGRPGIPRPGSDARGLSEDVVTTISDLAQSADRPRRDPNSSSDSHRWLRG